MSRAFHEVAGAFHDAWAASLDDPAVRFFNYGFEDPRVIDTGWLAPGDEPHRLHLNLIRLLLQGVPLAGRAVLDVSSGRGGTAEYIADYTEAAVVVGIDRCEGNVRLARRRIPPAKARFFVSDAEDLAVAAGRFDVVVNLEASHCYGRFGRFLEEVDRVLRPGGLFCFADLWDVPLPGVDWRAREALLGAMGYDVVREEDISLGVRRALEREADGIFRFLDSANPGQGRALADRVAQVSRDIRSQLAAGLCSYRLWHLSKPDEEDR